MLANDNIDDLIFWKVVISTSRCQQEKKQPGQASRVGQDLVKTEQTEPDTHSPNTNLF